MGYIKLLIKINKDKYNIIKSDLYNTFPADMKEWGLDAIRNGTIVYTDTDSIKYIENMKG